MSKSKKTSPQPVLSFVRTDEVVTRSVIDIKGTAAVVVTRMHAVSPATVALADIEQHVKQVARKTDPADPDSYWEVELPGLENVEWPDYEDLVAEVASQLNGEGVSVADWPAYRLDG